MPATSVRSFVLALAGLLAATASAHAARVVPVGRATPVLVRAEDYAFLVDTPAGWQHDCETLSERGICALFYRPGETFADAPVVLYVNPLEPDSLGLGHAIAHDVAALRENAPRLVVREEPTLYARYRRGVLVRRLEHAGAGGTTELAGYLAERTRTILFVASAKTPADLERGRVAFEQLVRSYSWVDDRVTAVP